MGCWLSMRRLWQPRGHSRTHCSADVNLMVDRLAWMARVVAYQSTSSCAKTKPVKSGGNPGASDAPCVQELAGQAKRKAVSSSSSRSSQGSSTTTRSSPVSSREIETPTGVPAESITPYCAGW